MRRLIARFRADTSGATAIEYALIAAGISTVIVTVITTLGTNVTAKYTSVSDAIKKP
ncbi:Flp family type IVb pilin [Rhodopseudomonas palustris]|uniref:Flp family type IVb pilin n=1 Tax=Rhodopseudomonas palustris TaxID=1076 RepID=A0A323ULZ2_RHOPL|nr:Flp family type IVb pilin [Rhodopseudomonas palustris]PZA13645.1 Flp family type IVb pilin [Rhodopseudomonas palustris]